MDSEENVKAENILYLEDMTLEEQTQLLEECANDMEVSQLFDCDIL